MHIPDWKKPSEMSAEFRANTRKSRPETFELPDIAKIGASLEADLALLGAGLQQHAHAVGFHFS